MTDQELIRALRGHSSQEWAIPRIAAARLEALLAEVEKLKAQAPKWRPASEPPELTETDRKRLRLFGRVAAPMFAVVVEGATESTALFFDGEDWFDEHNEQYDVDCWQPLPKPPSTEGGTV